MAGYPLYFQPIVDHLAYSKLRHWDLIVRKLAASALALIVPLRPDSCLPLLVNLVKIAVNSSGVTQQGAVTGIG